MEDRLLQTFILFAAFFVVFFTYVLQQEHYDDSSPLRRVGA
jgi:hypothetical protein